MTRKIFRRSQIICMRGLEYTISGFGKFLIVIAVSILGISLYRKYNKGSQKIMFWCTEQDFLILERNTYQIRMQACK